MIFLFENNIWTKKHIFLAKQLFFILLSYEYHPIKHKSLKPALGESTIKRSWFRWMLKVRLGLNSELR